MGSVTLCRRSRRETLCWRSLIQRCPASQQRITGAYVNLPLPLATAIHIEPRELVEWKVDTRYKLWLNLTPLLTPRPPQTICQKLKADLTPFSLGVDRSCHGREEPRAGIQGPNARVCSAVILVGLTALAGQESESCPSRGARKVNEVRGNPLGSLETRKLQTGLTHSMSSLFLGHGENTPFLIHTTIGPPPLILFSLLKL